MSKKVNKDPIEITFDEQVIQVMSELLLYGEQLRLEADEVISDFIDDTLIPTLKHNSPGPGNSIGKNEPTGEYRDGWVKKKDHKSKYKNRYSEYRVSNKNRPDLTFMLEHGFERSYKNRNGGKRTIHTADPRPHIRPAVEQTEPILINRLKSKLGGI